MCMDTVVVVISGQGAENNTKEVLIPVVTDDRISLVLGPHTHLLDPHTHYTALLSFTHGHFITTHFCEWVT